MSLSSSPNGESSARHVDADFEALFYEFHAPLCTFAYRYVLSREVAEELVQEVFLHLWEHRERLPERSRAKPYLFRAVRNAAMSYLRHQGVVRRAEADTLTLFYSARPTADADAHSAELAEALQRAIARLPERCRLVFTLSREQGMKYTEVAEALGISVKTVEMQMGRAYKALRQYLASYWP